jgi:serine protease Do
MEEKSSAMNEIDSPLEPRKLRQDETSPQAEAAILGAAEYEDEVHPNYEREYARTRVAWSKLMWLMATLACLLAIAQLIPYFAEQTAYSIARGKQRAEYETASKLLAESPLEALSQSGQRITQRVGPSVVHIQTRDGSLEEASLPFGPLGRRPMTTGQGSGVIVDNGGYIVTNYHVIRGSSSIRVLLSDGRRATATVVGLDMETDIAVLKINSDKLIAAEWADSEEMEVGSLVWAMGSPFGLERSVTSGILSGKHRAGMAGTVYQDFLQTDAAVNPGNSGGPLVDVRGRVVGINTAIVGDSYQGISFAVPSNVAKATYERIRDEGRVLRGWLGVQLDLVTDEIAQQLKLPDSKGVLVVDVVDQPAGKSPARMAGIEPKDVIRSWNGEAVNNPTALTNLVGKTGIGTEVEVVFYRNGDEMKLNVVVGQRPVMR